MSELAVAISSFACGVCLVATGVWIGLIVFGYKMWTRS